MQERDCLSIALLAQFLSLLHTLRFNAKSSHYDHNTVRSLSDSDVVCSHKTPIMHWRWRSPWSRFRLLIVLSRQGASSLKIMHSASMRHRDSRFERKSLPGSEGKLGREPACGGHVGCFAHCCQAPPNLEWRIVIPYACSFFFVFSIFMQRLVRCLWLQKMSRSFTVSPPI